MMRQQLPNKGHGSQPFMEGPQNFRSGSWNLCSRMKMAKCTLIEVPRNDLWRNWVEGRRLLDQARWICLLKRFRMIWIYIIGQGGCKRERWSNISGMTNWKKVMFIIQLWTSTFAKKCRWVTMIYIWFSTDNGIQLNEIYFNCHNSWHSWRSIWWIYKYS